MLDREGVVRARLPEHLLKMIGCLPDGHSASLSLGGGYEGTPVVSLVLLLPYAVRAALASAFILLCLALVTVEDRPDRLLA
jgi:hypothetical protein